MIKKKWIKPTKIGYKSEPKYIQIDKKSRLSRLKMD